MSRYGVPIIDHELADDGTVYVLKFPGGGKEYEFVSHASYKRLQRDLEIAQRAQDQAVLEATSKVQ
jgi:hypothetical protein